MTLTATGLLRPYRIWRTADHNPAPVYFKTEVARDNKAREYAERDQSTVFCQKWVADGRELGYGWHTDDFVVPGWWVYVTRELVGRGWVEVSPATPDRDEADEWTAAYRRSYPASVVKTGWRDPIPGELGITIVRIDNTYVDGVDITTRAALKTPGEDEDLDEWHDETAYLATGTGRASRIEALYGITVESSDRPDLIGKYFESFG
ncbi:hypothetical protein [Saccharopolyspora griseoalba]|uniref:ASCH domain-containing protein n=1 Tax=Saccharopolyspora griseoalba TaxID=1431848 RepID=A0ABW2LR49_9PSEU